MPGKSAYQLQMRAIRLGRYLALVGSFGVGLLFVDYGQRGPIGILGAIATGISLFGIFFFWMPMQIIANFKETAEVRAGYTTMRHSHRDVQQVEPGSFRLVRVANEQYISEELRLLRIHNGVETKTEVLKDQPLSGKPGIPMTTGTRVVTVLGALALALSFIFKLFL